MRSRTFWLCPAATTETTDIKTVSENQQKRKRDKLMSSVVIIRTNIFTLLSILLLFLYPVFFFYKNILLSSMIVFLIANEIGSFGVGDEEEEWWRGEAGAECVMERGGTHLRCKRDNVSFDGDTGADGQFAPAVLLQKRSA